MPPMRASYRELSNEELCAAAKTAAKDRSDSSELWEACRERLEDAESGDVAGMAWAYAKAGRRSGSFMREVAARASKSEEGWSPRDASTTAWALAKGGCLTAQAQRGISGAMLLAGDDANARDWSTLAWALATAKRPAPKVMAEICRLACEGERGYFDEQGAASVAWAIATFEKRGKAASTPGLDARALCALADPIETMKNSRTLALAAWAYATTSHEAARKLAAPKVARAACEVDNPNFRDVATLLWALGSLPGEHKAAVESLSRRLPSADSRSWSPQAAANALWGFARANVALTQTARASVSKIADQLLLRIDECSERDLADAAWALAVLDLPNEDFLNAISEAPQLRQASAVSLVQLGFAFYSFGRHRAGLAAVSDRAVSVLDDFDHRQLAAVATYVGGGKNDRFFAGLVSHLRKRMDARRREDRLDHNDLVALILALHKCTPQLVPGARNSIHYLALEVGKRIQYLSPKQRAGVAQVLLETHPRHPFLDRLDAYARYLQQIGGGGVDRDDDDVVVVVEDGRHRQNIEVETFIPSDQVFQLPPQRGGGQSSSKP